MAEKKAMDPSGKKRSDHRATVRRVADLAPIALVLILPACPGQQTQPPKIPTPVKLQPVEDDLLNHAEKNYNFTGPVADIWISLAAAEKVLEKQPQNERANYCAARASTWLIQFGGEGVDVKSLAKQGYKYARAAEKVDNKNGEYAFLAGSLLGFLAQKNPAAHMGSLKTIYDKFDRAVKLDPDFNGGEALRGLGMLLVKSPAWPIGVGDPDEGIKVLKKVVEAHPEHPANHLYLAEALVATEQYEEAAVPMAKTLELLSSGTWGVPGQVWKNQIERLREKIDENKAEESD
jgi:tetratricopeptide (TPR) repeat protein